MYVGTWKISGIDLLLKVQRPGPEIGAWWSISAAASRISALSELGGGIGDWGKGLIFLDLNRLGTLLWLAQARTGLPNSGQQYAGENFSYSIPGRRSWHATSNPYPDIDDEISYLAPHL
jgi:hypothetical protein